MYFPKGGFLLLCMLMTCRTSFARRRTSSRNDTCIDMTQTLQEGMLHLPKLQAFLLNIATNDVEDAKEQTEVITTSTHMGTHMNAPRHFNTNGIGVDEIPIQSFNGVPGYVVDVRNKTLEDAGYQISVADLEDFEKAQGENLSSGSLVMFLTGWGEKWSDAKSFLGTDQDDPEKLKFPGLSSLAATWLAQRDIVGVGTECASIEPSGEKSMAAHRTILNSPHNMYVLENLANMDQLPSKGIKVRAFPMKIGNSGGAPARVIACFRQRSSPSSSSRRRPSSRSSRRRHN